ncbi:hypothetical protein ACIRQP_31765 [Streptomyces sp. NPDC102274]|uniref:hypothetical protein n=1 Tax=Streptomyces sp. NPDC102274 TaxID=3366151 RepID=UPI0038098D73
MRLDRRARDGRRRRGAARPAPESIRITAQEAGLLQTVPLSDIAAHVRLAAHPDHSSAVIAMALSMTKSSVSLAGREALPAPIVHGFGFWHNFCDVATLSDG